jgi:hypothetical protein
MLLTRRYPSIQTVNASGTTTSIVPVVRRRARAFVGVFPFDGE